MGKKNTRRAVPTITPDQAATLAAAPSEVVLIGQVRELSDMPDSGSILELFEKWRAVRNQFNEGVEDQETEDLLYREMRGIEVRILAMPCNCAADLAAKFQILTDCGGVELSPAFAVECAALLSGAVKGLTAQEAVGG